MLVLLALGLFRAHVVRGEQGYVQAAARWVESQRQGAYDLARYAGSREEAHYRAFRQALRVPQAYRRARIALQGPAPAREDARQAFLEGGSHPGDAGAMIDLLVRFPGTHYIEQATAVWEQADALIVRMDRLGGELRVEIASSAPDAGRIEGIFARLEGVNRAVDALGERLSAVRRDGRQRLQTLVTWIGSGAVLSVLGLGLVFARRIGAGVSRTEHALVQSESRFRSLVDSNIIGVVFWNADGTITDANDVFLELVGYERQALGRLRWDDLTPPEQTAVHAQACQRLVEDGVCPAYEQQLVRSDGARVPAFLGGTSVDDDATYVVCFALDMSENKRQEEGLRLAATVFEASGEGIMITDAQPRIISVNRSLCELTGFEPQDLVGKSPMVLGPGLASPESYRRIWSSLQETGQWQGEMLDRGRTGEQQLVWLSISAVKDEAGVVSHYVAIFTDITERKAAEDRLRHQAQHDSLTGLPNRSLFQDRLEQALVRAERHRTEVAILFLDLDRFKPVNDALGHQVGDQVLQQIAARLVGVVRGGDTVSRLGGDEFVILLEEVDRRQSASEVAQKILDAVGKPYTVDGRTVQVGPSIGICVYPWDGTDAQTLMRNADAAMYRAKSEGGHAFQFFG